MAIADRLAHMGGSRLTELLIAVAVVGILSAIAIPRLIGARQAGNEASAIASVRAINAAQSAFAASCGGGGYATSLRALTTPPPMGVPFVELAAPDAGAAKDGYLLDIAAGGAVVRDAAVTCNAAAPSATSYLVTATPISVGSTGQRSFASDARGAIYQDSTGGRLAGPLTETDTISVLQ